MVSTEASLIRRSLKGSMHGIAHSDQEARTRITARSCGEGTVSLQVHATRTDCASVRLVGALRLTHLAPLTFTIIVVFRKSSS